MCHLVSFIGELKRSVSVCIWDVSDWIGVCECVCIFILYFTLVEFIGSFLVDDDVWYKILCQQTCWLFLCFSLSLSQRLPLSPICSALRLSMFQCLNCTSQSTTWNFQPSDIWACMQTMRECLNFERRREKKDYMYVRWEPKQTYNSGTGYWHHQQHWRHNLFVCMCIWRKKK